MDLRDFGFVAAGAALELVLFEVTRRQDVLVDAGRREYGESYVMGVIRPHMSQMCTRNASETSNNLRDC